MAVNQVNIGSIPNDGTGDPLRNAFNVVNGALTYLEGLINQKIGEAPNDGQQYARQDSAWELVIGGTDEKVKATSQGTAGYLSAVIDYGNFIDNAGDSEQVIIEGVLASTSQIQAFSTSKVIAAPYQMPQFAPRGVAVAAANGSAKGKGLRVYRTNQSSRIKWEFELDLDGLSAISATDLADMWFSVLDKENPLSPVTGLMNGATLAQYIGGLVGWFMAVSPQTLYSANPPYSSIITILDNNSNQYTGIATNQFTVVETGGHLTGATFAAAIGNAVAATVQTDGTPFDSSGSVYGYVVIKWTHPTIGGSITKTIELINNEDPGGGGGAIGTDIAVEIVSAWPATSDDINRECLLILPGSGMRAYKYDSVNERYCYDEFSISGGLCLAPKTKS